MYIILEINLDSYLEKSVYKNPEKVEYILIHINIYQQVNLIYIL